MIADTIWDMILGKAGRLPGPVDPELKKMAEEKGLKFLDNDPQENYPDDLDVYREKMKANGWELGQDDEELFEYSMHPSQYEAYKSGKAKADFEADLAKRKAAANASGTGEIKAQDVVVTVNGQQYTVSIAPNDGSAPAAATAAVAAAPAGAGVDVLAPLEGKFFLVKNSSETAVKVGDKVAKGQTIGYIEAMKTYNAVTADQDGTITAILANPGDKVFEDDPIFKIG